MSPHTPDQASRSHPVPTPPPPRVVRTISGRIALDMDAEQAMTLVRLLAHYDGLTAERVRDAVLRMLPDPAAVALTPVTGYSRQQWTQTAVDLLLAVRRRGRVAATSPVSTLVPGGLRLVAGKQVSR